MPTAGDPTQEIERVFLVEDDRWQKLATSSARIDQAYLPIPSPLVTFTDKGTPLLSIGMYDGEVMDSLEIPRDHAERMAAIDRPTLRIRISDGQAFVTVKGPKKDGVGAEFEYEVDVTCADEWMNRYGGYEVRKTRHLVPFASMTWEVDVFRGRLEGLIMAEVEMPTTDAHVDLPSWVGREVTDDHRYRNAVLGKNGIPEDAAASRPAK